MSTIHAAGIGEVIDNNGTDNAALRWGISTTADDTRVDIDGDVTTVGPNPAEPSFGQVPWDEVGNDLESNAPATWEADAAGEPVEQFKVQVDAGNGNFQDFGTWNSSADFGSFTTEVGSTITVENFDIGCGADGIAEAIAKGANNLTAHIYLTDGSGTRIADNWAQKTPPGQSIVASSNGIEYTNDVTFTNNSGSDQVVGGAEVEWAGTGNIIIDGSIADVTVPDNGEIVFTSLEVLFSGLD